MTSRPTPPSDDALIDQLWDYLQGKLAADQVASFEAALRDNPDAVRAGVDLIEVMVMTREVCQREGEARKELFLGSAQQHRLDDVISAVADPEAHVAKMTLADLAKLEADAQVVDLPLSDVSTSPTRREDMQDPITIQQWLGAGGYLLRHSLKAKATVAAGLAAVLLLSLFLIPWSGSDTPDPAPLANTETPATDPGPNKSDTTQVVATLTAEHNAIWAEGASAPGSQLHPGDRLTLTAGFAEITTARGAVAILEAPATVELLNNDNAIRLHTGKLVGICETESSKGFIVRTPHMEITDLGTRFGVDASFEATDLHVIEGEVEVAMPSENSSSPLLNKRLTQFQSVRSDNTNNTIATIETAIDQFDSALNIHRLPGTGAGLSPEEPDPAWRLVAVDGVPLTGPISLNVASGTQSSSFSGIDRFGRWVNYRDSRLPAAGRDRVYYTVQTEIMVPQDTDLKTAKLSMLSYIDDSFVELRFNGVAFKGMDIPDSPRTEPLRFSRPLTELGLRHGTNTVTFEIGNKPKTELGLVVLWHLVGSHQEEDANE